MYFLGLYFSDQTTLLLYYGKLAMHFMNADFEIYLIMKVTTFLWEINKALIYQDFDANLINVQLKYILGIYYIHKSNQH